MERVPPSICPEAVTEPWYHQRWDSLTFLHWEVEPSAIQRLLPKSLVVDTLDGAACVGLVPFEMQNVEVRVPALPGPPRTVGVPGSQRFPETNVRTYVIGPAGQRGVCGGQPVVGIDRRGRSDVGKWRRRHDRHRLGREQLRRFHSQRSGG